LGSNEGRTYYKLLAEFLRREKYLVPISKMRPLNRHSWGISVAMTLEDSGYFVLGGSYRSQTIANKLYIWTPARHLVVGSVTYELRSGARRFDVGEDGVPSCA
jgi:hypothetical protein